jgi:hypothetical protein
VRVAPEEPAAIKYEVHVDGPEEVKFLESLLAMLSRLHQWQKRNGWLALLEGANAARARAGEEVKLIEMKWQIDRAADTITYLTLVEPITLPLTVAFEPIHHDDLAAHRAFLAAGVKESAIAFRHMREDGSYRPLAAIITDVDGPILRGTALVVPANLRLILEVRAA